MAHQPLGGRPVGVVRAHTDVPFPIEDSKVYAFEKMSDIRTNLLKIQEIAEEFGITPAQVFLVIMQLGLRP
jgi:hypothetical protein